MKRLNYKRMIKKSGFISFPEAVEGFAMATASLEWKSSKYSDYMPCAVAVDPRTKKLRVKRYVLYRVGRGYRLTSEALPSLKKNEIKAFRAHRAHYTSCAKKLIGQIAGKKIRAIAAIPYMPYIQLDGSNDNLLTSQFDTLCATGYIGHLLPNGDVYYGLVSVDKADLAKFIKGEQATVTSGAYCKTTPEIEEAHREFIKRLIAYVGSPEGVAASKGMPPQFIVDDFKLAIVCEAIGAIASSPELGRMGVAPSSLRRIIMTYVEGIPNFPSKRGGRRNQERRELGRRLIQKCAKAIVATGDEYDEEGEDDSGEV